MFGVSFTELLLIGAVTLMIVGPARLPKLLGTLGRWSAKLRRITTEVRYQSGIDDILRKEGISGGLNELRELRNVARGGLSGLASSAMQRPQSRTTSQAKSAAAGASASTASASVTGPATAAVNAAGGAAKVPAAVDVDPFADVPMDPSREYPTEGCDAYGALPDDMWTAPGQKPAVAAPASAAETAAPKPIGPTGSDAAAKPVQSASAVAEDPSSEAAVPAESKSVASQTDPQQ